MFSLHKALVLSFPERLAYFHAYFGPVHLVLAELLSEKMLCKTKTEKNMTGSYIGLYPGSCFPHVSVCISSMFILFICY